MLSTLMALPLAAAAVAIVTFAARLSRGEARPSRGQLCWLAVPVLAFAAGLPQKKAHATAIAVILPLCLVSTVVYAVRGGFETDILLPTVLGVLAGGIAGAALLKKLSAPVLNLLFYGLMLFAGIKMMV